jgi:hypothetical protein
VLQAIEAQLGSRYMHNMVIDGANNLYIMFGFGYWEDGTDGLLADSWMPHEFLRNYLTILLFFLSTTDRNQYYRCCS